MPNPTKKDRDEITVAKSIFDEIVEFTETVPVEDTPKQARARKAAKARAEKLSDERKSEIAKTAAEKRWEPSH